MTRGRDTAALRRGAGALAVAALVVVWWATRFVDHGKQRALDTVLMLLPTYAATWERFRAGVVPLWNPYQLCGIPWIGTIQGGTFYPFHVLYAALPLNTALAITGVLHLVIAALATTAFVRRLGLGAAPALLAAVVFTLRGHVAVGMLTANYVEAVVWLPVGAVALVDLVRRPGRRSVALLATATAMTFLAGHPQPSVYIVYTWASLLPALLIAERPPLAGIATRTSAFTAALLLGAMVASVQVLPALELTAIGTRSAGGQGDKTMFQISAEWTSALLTFRLQSISGSAYAFGVLVLMLVPAAVLAPGRRAVGCWALGVTGLSAAWALGRYTPLFDLYLALPGLRLFREPGRLGLVTDFSVAVAAAFGLAAVVGTADGDPTVRARRPFVAVGFAALTLAVVADLVGRGWAPNADPAFVVFAALAVTMLVALLLVRGPQRRTLAAAIVAAALIEIASNPWVPLRLPYAASDLAPYHTLDGDFRRLAAIAGHDRIWRALTGIDQKNTLKLATWHRVRSLTDYEPVNLRRQSNFFTYFMDGSTTAKRYPWLFFGDIPTIEAPPDGTAPGSRHRLLDLAAVRWITFARGALIFPAVRELVEQARLVRRYTTDELVVLENPGALPRAFVTYRTRTAPTDVDALFAVMSSEGFDPLVESFVEDPTALPDGSDAPRGHPATFVRDDETTVELEATLERPGLIVLADSYYPGWHATVDGVAAPIVATNHLFRGVPAPAGTHRIRFVYEPASVRIGGALSATGLCVLAWLALGRRRPASFAPTSPRAN